MTKKIQEWKNKCKNIQTNKSESTNLANNNNNNNDNEYEYESNRRRKHERRASLYASLPTST